MKHLIFVFSALILVSCGKSPAEVEFDKIQIEARAHKDDLPKLDFSNPSVFMGSDFGRFFQKLQEDNKFDEMIAFTSSRSIEKFGKDAILEFYKNELDFRYDITPRSIRNFGDTISLNYQANIIATKRVIRINVVVENDSCKIVLPDKLADFPS